MCENLSVALLAKAKGFAVYCTLERMEEEIEGQLGDSGRIVITGDCEGKVPAGSGEGHQGLF